MTEFEDTTPPAGEDIHLPGPSVKPLLVAIGITCTIIGLTISYWFSVFGLILFVSTTALWVRDTRHDIKELPEEHGH